MGITGKNTGGEQVGSCWLDFKKRGYKITRTRWGKKRTHRLRRRYWRLYGEDAPTKLGYSGWSW